MDKKLKAFLDLIAFSEGTSTSPYTKNDGYDIIVDGLNSPHILEDYRGHPNILVRVRAYPLLESTAAGRYQLLYRWYQPYCAQLGLKDFSPASQDAIALQQMKEHHAVALVEAGDIAGAIAACSTIWASFPGNSYGQGGHSPASLVAKYHELEGASSVL
jgi:muramidase (phage lysozyme)